jgi:hypothetical protein
MAKSPKLPSKGTSPDSPGPQTSGYSEEVCEDPSNAFAQSQSPETEGVCTEPIDDFRAYIADGELMGTLTIAPSLCPEDWDVLHADAAVKRAIATNFLLLDAIVLCDGTGFDACDVLFTYGQASIVAESDGVCSLAVVDLIGRHADGAFVLWGIVTPETVGLYMEATAQLVTSVHTLPAASIFAIMGGMTVEARRRNMQALADDGSLEMLILDESQAWGDYLATLNAADLASLTNLLPEQDQSTKDVENQAKKSENPERAQKALAELTALQAGDRSNPKRLSDGLVNLLVWGVGKAMNDTALGSEGIIGIHHAKNAAEALIGMPYEMYTAIVAKLVMSGGDTGDRQVESVLILKAIAARKAEYTGGKSDVERTDAHEAVTTFADDIRGSEAEQLKRDTTLRDTGDGQGLQQKWTMSCGPTSIQISHGSADPIYAKEVSDTAKHTLDYDNDVGKEQKDYLGKDGVPRQVMSRWEAFTPALTTWAGAAPANAAPAQALANEIMGGAPNAGDLATGIAWATGQGFTADDIASFKKFYPFNEPGWGNNEFATKANAEISDPANGAFDERGIPPNYVVGSAVPISTMTKGDCDVLYDALFEGKDVPMGIMWTGGGGHFMVFTDCKTTKVGGVDTRQYLLSDPWKGTSGWITEANVIAGNVNPFGTGAIDSIYL